MAYSTLGATHGLVVAASISLIVSGLIYQGAFACTCARQESEVHYERSDVVFLGRVIGLGTQPHDVAQHVTFNVSKSWKGVDTKIVTIRTGDGIGGCQFYRFEQGIEYLVYGVKDVASINVGLCQAPSPVDSSGSADPSPFVSHDLQFLESRTPLELNAGRTTSINIFPIMAILGSFVAISIATFVIVKKRA